MADVPIEIAGPIAAGLVTTIGILWKSLNKARDEVRLSLREGIEMEKSRSDGVELVTKAFVDIKAAIEASSKQARKEHSSLAKLIREKA